MSNILDLGEGHVSCSQEVDVLILLRRLDAGRCIARGTGRPVDPQPSTLPEDGDGWWTPPVRIKPMFVSQRTERGWAPPIDPRPNFFIALLSPRLVLLGPG